MNWGDVAWLGIGLFIGEIGGLLVAAWFAASGREFERERIEKPWIKNALELRLSLADARLEIDSLRMHLQVERAVGPCAPSCDCPPGTEVEGPTWKPKVLRWAERENWARTPSADRVVVAEGQQC